MLSEHPGAETIGAARLAFAAMRADYDSLLGDIKAIPASVVLNFALKGGVGRDRARQRIDGLVSRAPFIETDRALLWRCLLPRRDPLGTEHPRWGVEVMGAMLGVSRGKPISEIVPLGLWVSLHTLNRAFQRTLGRVDLATLALRLHDAVQDSPAAIFDTTREAGAWCFPLGDDAVLCRVRVVPFENRSDSLVCVSADTFLNRDMLGADQEAQRRACLHPHPGPKMRDGLLLPAAMRPAAPTVDGFVSLPHNAAQFLKSAKIKQKTTL
ncbi:hypothetical protein [Lichenicoccus roseus]|uniref:Uncharacterized protein n=1 Tax=Lichenicoccus roseus TaxID=2683649 RepID=A0A5R9IYM5_9PROT|nr:hypothetical protein [Lichenicoccus roseus]TLU70584.1 hypothetical protein FE263_21095 [Lichenicoccus roseus]